MVFGLHLTELSFLDSAICFARDPDLRVLMMIFCDLQDLGIAHMHQIHPQAGRNATGFLRLEWLGSHIAREVVFHLKYAQIAVVVRL